MPQTQELALPETSSYAIMQVDSGELIEALVANTGGDTISPFELDVVKVPSGQGAPMWMVPSLEGDTAKQTLEGIVVFQRTVRSFWRESLDAKGGGSPPDCSSQDGETGVGDPGGECATCEYAQFGSGQGGRAQACKQSRLLFLVRPESALPMVVKAPPSSLKGIRSYMLRLAGAQVPYYGAITSLALAKKKNASGIDYFEIVPSLVRRLDPDELERMRQVSTALAPIFAAHRFEADE